MANPPVDFRLLAGAGVPARDFKAGDVIFRQGDPAHRNCSLFRRFDARCFKSCSLIKMLPEKGRGVGFVSTRCQQTPRRFLPPWTVEELDACFVVRDHNGQALAYVAFNCSTGSRRVGVSCPAASGGDPTISTSLP